VSSPIVEPDAVDQRRAVSAGFAGQPGVGGASVATPIGSSSARRSAGNSAAFTRSYSVTAWSARAAPIRCSMAVRRICERAASGGGFLRRAGRDAVEPRKRQRRTRCASARPSILSSLSGSSSAARRPAEGRREREDSWQNRHDIQPLIDAVWAVDKNEDVSRWRGLRFWGEPVAREIATSIASLWIYSLLS
jgi:hypothetical protein